MSHPPLKFALATLAALLLAGAAQAQQTVPDAATAPAASATKTKVKTKRDKAAAPAPTPAASGPTALAGTPPPPAGGPRPPRPGGPDAGPGRGPQGPGGPGPDGPGGHHKGGVQALTDFAGTLTEYSAGNDDQVYDAFGLKTSAGTETVRFPRHLGQSLMAAAKPGSAVTVTGFRDTDPQGRATLHLVSVTAGGQTLQATPPARPSTPPAEEATTVRGTVQRLTQDPRGQANGLVLNDGTLLHLSPDAAAQLSEKLKVGATVAATGTVRAAQPGEVAAQPVRVVRAQTITLDGVQFLVR